MATAKKEITAAAGIEIMPVELVRVPVRIVGTTPLITHAWSEKAKREMLDNMRGKTKVKKKHSIRVPVADFIGSINWMDHKPDVDLDHLPEKAEDADLLVEEAFNKAVAAGARFGFPASGIKEAAVMAASRNEIPVKTTVLRGLFYVEGEGSQQLVEIKGDKPVMREDMVKVGGMTKVADLRYRAEFTHWYMDLTLVYNKNGPVGIEQIINLLNLGGFTCGIGEWRMERDGNFGMFVVAGTPTD